MVPLGYFYYIIGTIVFPFFAASAFWGGGDLGGPLWFWLVFFATLGMIIFGYLYVFLGSQKYWFPKQNPWILGIKIILITNSIGFILDMLIGELPQYMLYSNLVLFLVPAAAFPFYLIYKVHKHFQK